MPYGMEPPPSVGVDAWYAAGATVQPGWKYCVNCKCLYWGNALAESACQYANDNGPANGSTGYHHAPGATVYTAFMM
jgi:hypothetical protein